jgi:hypothetical protein
LTPLPSRSNSAARSRLASNSAGDPLMRMPVYRHIEKHSINTAEVNSSAITHISGATLRPRREATLFAEAALTSAASRRHPNRPSVPGSREGCAGPFTECRRQSGYRHVPHPCGQSTMLFDGRYVSIEKARIIHATEQNTPDASRQHGPGRGSQARHGQRRLREGGGGGGGGVGHIYRADAAGHGGTPDAGVGAAGCGRSSRTPGVRIGYCSRRPRWAAHRVLAPAAQLDCHTVAVRWGAPGWGDCGGLDRRA